MSATQEQLELAMKVAVRYGLIPKTADEESYLRSWNGMRQVIEAVLATAEVRAVHCEAIVHRKDTYRRTGRGRTGFEMHYTEGRCKRTAREGGLCRQHRKLEQQGANIARAKEWMT